MITAKEARLISDNIRNKEKSLSEDILNNINDTITSSASKGKLAMSISKNKYKYSTLNEIIKHYENLGYQCIFQDDRVIIAW